MSFAELPIPTATVVNQAAAVRAAISVGADVNLHPEAVTHFFDQIAELEAAAYPADQKYVVVAGAGDSMGTDTGFMTHLVTDLTRKYGQGCVGTSGLIQSIGSGEYTTGATYAGGASLTSGNYTYFPNGEYHNLPSGGSVVETAVSPNIHSGYRTIRCWYGIRSGGGTLTFSVSQTGASISPKSVDTSVGTPGTIGYVDFTSADGLLQNGKPILTVSSASAISHYLGCVMFLNSGLVPLRIGRGGSSSAQATTSPAANLGTYATAMDLRLVCFASKETGEDETLANLTTLIDRWQEQVPKASFVLVGATPSPTGEADVDPAQNALLRSKALEFGWAFVDGQLLLQSTAYLSTVGDVPTYGWNEANLNAPHLSPIARRFISSWIWDKLLLRCHVPGGRLSGGEPLLCNELRETAIRVGIWAQTSSTYGSSNFTHITPDFGRMTYRMTASPAPVANSGRGGQIAAIGPAMNLRSIMRYRINDGVLIDGIFASILIGGTNQNEINGMTNASNAGIRIVHGADTISGQLVPFIQFAVKGSGVAETLSPKFYHSSSVGAAPYAGGTWLVNQSNMYWVEYFGNGSSATKRLRAWHQPCRASSGSDRMPLRRLIADWTGTITVGGSSFEQTFFGLYTNGTPSTPGGVRDVFLEDYSVDFAPNFVPDSIWDSPSA